MRTWASVSSTRFKWIRQYVDDSSRKVEWAMWHHDHTNLQHGKEMGDINPMRV